MRALCILVTGLAIGCASPSRDPALPLMRFSELDANGDGAVDAEEFRTLADALFERVDADGDGKISAAEHEKFAEQHRPPQRHRRPRSGGGTDGGWPGGGGGPY